MGRAWLSTTSVPGPVDKRNRQGTRKCNFTKTKAPVSTHKHVLAASKGQVQPDPPVINTDEPRSGLKRDGLRTFFLSLLCSNADALLKFLSLRERSQTFVTPRSSHGFNSGMIPLKNVLLLDLATQSQKKQRSTGGYVFSPDTNASCRPT